MTHVGLIHGETAGRSDAVTISIEAGCYVLPAYCVAALGEGDTMRGDAALQEMFPGKAGDGLSWLIDVAAGEWVIPAVDAQAVGHDAIDAWVRSVKRQWIKKLEAENNYSGGIQRLIPQVGYVPSSAPSARPHVSDSPTQARQRTPSHAGLFSTGGRTP